MIKGACDPDTLALAARQPGAVFTDVDVADATTIEYYDINGKLLLTVSAPAVNAQQTLSFVGATLKFSPSDSTPTSAPK